MASSRRRARPSEPAADLLSSLPAHLLDGILNRLDPRYAVRTSALSRAWRRRWEALPYLSLSFLDNPGTPPVAVDSVLLRYTGHISHFSFPFVEHSVGRIADWFIALCNRGVEPINLHYSSTAPVAVYGFTLHSPSSYAPNSCTWSCTSAAYSIFLWASLVLEELKLYAAKFPENGESQMEAILGASPLLKTLDLSFVDIRGDGSNEWVIRGPSLTEPYDNL